MTHPDLAAAEHWISALPEPPEWAFTHLVREPHPHVTVSLVPPPFGAGFSGRAVHFPGVARLVGVLSVAEILRCSAIDAVRVLGGGSADSDALVVTRDHVRPQWVDGSLTLVTTPVAGGRIAPFEVPSPTPCCGAHQTAPSAV